MIGEQGKVQNPVIKTGGLEILVDRNLKTGETNCRKYLCTGIQQTGGTYRVKADVTIKEYEDHIVVGEEKFVIYPNEFTIK